MFAFQVLLSAEATGLRVDSKAQAEQVRSISVQRVGPVLGRLSGSITHAMDEAVRLHLAL